MNDIYSDNDNDDADDEIEVLVFRCVYEISFRLKVRKKWKYFWHTNKNDLIKFIKSKYTSYNEV